MIVRIITYNKEHPHVNDCTIHPLFPELPFGGVGNSGMGKYHGRWGFEAFTNARGVMYHSSAIGPGVRYPIRKAHLRTQGRSKSYAVV